MSNKFIFTRDDLIWDYLRALNCLRGTGDGIRAPVTVTPEPVYLSGRRAFGPKPSKQVYPERGERYKEMIIDEVKDERYEWKPSREDLKAMWERLEDGEGDLQSE